jgi:uncharacterized membrane protein
MHDVALLMHLFGAFLLFGGLAVAGAGFESARRRRSPGEIAVLLGLTRIGVLLVALGTLLLLGFGLWLVDLGHFGFGAAWVDVSLGLLLGAIALGTAAGQRPKQARKRAVAERERSEASPELRALLDDPVARGLNYLSAALILVVVVLMVTKPGS